MNPLALALAGGAALFALSKKKGKQGVAAGSNVYVSTPVSSHVTAEQAHATPVKPRPPHASVTVQGQVGGNPAVPAISGAAGIAVAAATTPLGIGFAPPNAVQPGQSAPIVSTPGGSASVLLVNTKDVQRALNTLGFVPKLDEDGSLGTKTSNNIRQFQSQNGLPPSGNADPATKMALSAALIALAAGPRITVGQAVENIDPANAPAYTNKGLQRVLNICGANPQLVEDGELKGKTIAAIKTFQLTHGLTPDGVAGPKTRAALAMAAKAAGQ